MASNLDSGHAQGAMLDDGWGLDATDGFGFSQAPEQSYSQEHGLEGDGQQAESSEHTYGGCTYQEVTITTQSNRDS